eukprot:3497312-Prorocentrum_lima.AAC.1
MGSFQGGVLWVESKGTKWHAVTPTTNFRLSLVFFKSCHSMIGNDCNTFNFHVLHHCEHTMVE